MENHSYQTIKTLDNPPRVLFWGIDEFFSLIGPAVIGVALGHPWLAIAGIFSKPLYTRMKRKMPYGAFTQKIYWILPTKNLKTIIKTLPPSHNREYIL